MAYQQTKYKVIADFEDLQDGGRPYFEGDFYPLGNKRPSNARIKELLGDKNKRGRPLIQESDTDY